MDIKKELLKEHSKAQALKITRYVGDDKEQFAILMDLFFDKDYRVAQRAAWVVSHCYDQNPALVEPYLSKMVLNLGKEISIAVKRNTVRILQFIEIPEELMGDLADCCFKFLNDPKEPIAIKVFSMTIIWNISKVYPELQAELKMAIEDRLPYGSAGFKSRGKQDPP